MNKVNLNGECYTFEMYKFVKLGKLKLNERKGLGK